MIFLYLFYEKMGEEGVAVECMRSSTSIGDKFGYEIDNILFLGIKEGSHQEHEMFKKDASHKYFKSSR